MARLDDEIDRLYQLPPEEFTAARNAVAKGAGARAAEIRGLTKPSLPVWGLNQLYWTRPKIYNALVESAEDLRATHKAVLGGKRGDLRGAGKSHDVALDAAVKATLEIIAGAGNPVTDATRQAINTSMRALPGADPPGRLTKTLQPGGFEMLAGIKTSGRVKTSGPARAAREPAPAPSKSAHANKEEAARAAKVREAAAAAARAVRTAEQDVRREEFEAARATRDAEKAERRVEEARAALEQAENELREAERHAAAAAKKRDSARARAGRAEEALAQAKAREEGRAG